MQNKAARVILQVPRRCRSNSLLQEVPVQPHITYKVTVLTYKTRQTSVPKYLGRHIRMRSNMLSVRSSCALLLHMPFHLEPFAYICSEL
jgi:hypothetical protein